MCLVRLKKGGAFKSAQERKKHHFQLDLKKNKISQHPQNLLKQPLLGCQALKTGPDIWIGFFVQCSSFLFTSNVLMEMFYHHKPWIKYIYLVLGLKHHDRKKKDIQASKMKENLILNCRKKCEYREDRDKIREFNRERLHILIMSCW